MRHHWFDELLNEQFWCYYPDETVMKGWMKKLNTSKMRKLREIVGKWQGEKKVLTLDDATRSAGCVVLIIMVQKHMLMRILHWWHTDNLIRYNKLSKLDIQTLLWFLIMCLRVMINVIWHGHQRNRGENILSFWKTHLEIFFFNTFHPQKLYFVVSLLKHFKLHQVFRTRCRENWNHKETMHLNQISSVNLNDCA